MPVARCTASGNFRRVRGGEAHERRRRVAPALPPDPDADRAVRIDQLAGRPQHRGHGGAGLLLASARGIEQLSCEAEGLRRHREMPVRRELRHQPTHLRPVAAAQIEQQALEVARDLDVHARADRRVDRAGAVFAAGKEARQDVVAVGRDDQLGDRQADLRRDVAGIDVAEIAGRHGERDLAPRRAERQARGDVVHGLGDDARPVDRVDRGKLQPGAKGSVVEHRLQQRLAVVERALDRDVVDVGGSDRGHLAALHLGDAAVRMQDHDRHARAPGAGLDRGGAGIAGGRADDRDRPAALRQKMLEQVAQQLQGDVLEGERRPVEQLEQPVVGVELAQGRHGDVIEAGIRLVDQPAQLGLAQGTFDERGENARGDLLIGGAAQGVQPVAIEARPAFAAGRGRRRRRARPAGPARNRTAARRRGC